ncbi:MAG: outer membrane protein assembly factor BamB family protein [Armatimonadota bacterium]
MLFRAHALRWCVAALVVVGLFWTSPQAVAGEWPTLRGNAMRTGFAADVPAGVIRPPFRLVWTRCFLNERIGTGVEPIVADGRAYVGTHGGRLYALDAATGRPLWCFAAKGPFLHSPAVSSGVVVAPCADGRVYGLDAASGALRWHSRAFPGGFATSPVVVRGMAVVGSRLGTVVAFRVASGKELWRRQLGAPIRQTAASDARRVYLTGEDIRVRCLDATSGRVIWTSPQLPGETARDYYPVLVRSRSGRVVVVVRTNPSVNFGRRIGEDRHVLCAAAGVDDSSWQTVDSWTKDPKAMGDRAAWVAEQDAVRKYLAEHRDAQTFFLLDGDSGRVLPPPPIMWMSGCQGVPSPPVVLPDGRLATLFRTAYGNWSLGVAPLVGLGLLNIASGAIDPLRHVHGIQPPWNTFWGTADESQTLVGVPGCLLVVHQGTLSMFDLTTGRLERIWGGRDTFGGYQGLPWARNEWHGPARGSAVVVRNRIYWITGSRLLCIEAGQEGGSKAEAVVRPQDVPRRSTAPRLDTNVSVLAERIQQTAAQVLSRKWAPLCLEPGLAGREVAFAYSSELFEALAWAYPHLGPSLQTRAKALLAEHWRLHNPCSPAGRYQLTAGARREWYWLPPSVLAGPMEDQPHPFGGMYAVALYADRCGERRSVLEQWPMLKQTFSSFMESGWALDPEKGDLNANRYLASLLAFSNLAAQAGDAEARRLAVTAARLVQDALLAWWDRAGSLQMPGVGGVAELDRFIGSGNALFLRLRPHRAKLGLFHGLTPKVAALVRSRRLAEVRNVWTLFARLCPTWYLVGEERQVHYGENYLDPPDFAMSAFRAYAWLCGAGGKELAARTDIPFCRADLYYLTKLSIAADRASAENKAVQRSRLRGL